jgi:hypothetical protein
MSGDLDATGDKSEEELVDLLQAVLNQLKSAAR